jgi:hypothetical protein
VLGEANLHHAWQIPERPKQPPHATSLPGA